MSKALRNAGISKGFAHIFGSDVLINLHIFISQN